MLDLIFGLLISHLSNFKSRKEFHIVREEERKVTSLLHKYHSCIQYHTIINIEIKYENNCISSDIRNLIAVKT